LGIISLGFDLTNQLLIRSFALVKYWRINEYDEAVCHPFIDFKKAYDSVRREGLYSTCIEFGVPLKLLRLIKMCSNETCNKVCIGKHLLCFQFLIVYNKEMLYHHQASTLL
jgi:hypothetical protein